MTVSDRTASGRRAAASSEMTPPYENPARCAPVAEQLRHLARLHLEVDRARAAGPADSPAGRGGRA